MSDNEVIYPFILQLLSCSYCMSNRKPDRHSLFPPETYLLGKRDNEQIMTQLINYIYYKGLGRKSAACSGNLVWGPHLMCVERAGRGDQRMREKWPVRRMVGGEKSVRQEQHM